MRFRSLASITTAAVPMMGTSWLQPSRSGRPDHANPLFSCLPLQGQGNRAAVPGVDARVEQLKPHLGAKVADGGPARSQGDQGLALSQRRASARSSSR